MQHARRDYQTRIQDALPEPLGGIPDNEPVFLLRAQDKLAGLTIRIYGFLADLAGCDPDLVLNAKAQAALMESWDPQKLPDLPDPLPSPSRGEGQGGGGAGAPAPTLEDERRLLAAQLAEKGFSLADAENFLITAYQDWTKKDLKALQEHYL